MLCNACGLFLKLHGKPRPISLKTDVIKSRNRVKASSKNGAQNGGLVGGGREGSLGAGSDHGGQGRVQGVSLAASHPGLARLDPEMRPVAQAQMMHTGPHSQHSGENSPLSRAGTPGLAIHGGSIAPQHMFDQVIQIPGEEVSVPPPQLHRTHSASYGPSPLMHQSSFHSGEGEAGNSPTHSNSHANGVSHLDHSAIASIAEVTAIKTRVSELEVINDLFRGRVAELEQMLAERQAELEGVRAEKAEMSVQLEKAKRRVGEMESGEKEVEGARRSKRLRVDEGADEN